MGKDYSPLERAIRGIKPRLPDDLPSESGIDFAAKHGPRGQADPSPEERARGSRPLEPKGER